MASPNGKLSTVIRPIVEFRDCSRCVGKVENPPQSRQVTNSPGQMAKIALESRGNSDPALDFKDGQVHILDSFLAFYLRYGSWLNGST
jgi:hypothetical protein